MNDIGYSSAALHQPVCNLVVAAIAQALCGKEIVKAEPAVLGPCSTKGGHVNVLVNHLDIETGSEKISGARAASDESSRGDIPAAGAPICKLSLCLWV